MKKIWLSSLFIFFFVLSCNSFHINPVQIELVVINNNENRKESQKFEKVFFDPYILFLNNSKLFSLNEKDIKNIQVNENEAKIYVTFLLKRKNIKRFSQFTSENLHSLIAIKINGKVNSIARIDEVIDNGKIQFVANMTTRNNVVTFLKQFFL